MLRKVRRPSAFVLFCLTVTALSGTTQPARAVFFPAVSLSLTKTAVGSPVSNSVRGATVKWRLDYSCASSVPGASCNNTTLDDVLPPGVNLTSVTGGGTPTATGVTWNFGNLAAGSSGSVEINGSVDCSTSPQSLNNEATIGAIRALAVTRSSLFTVNAAVSCVPSSLGDYVWFDENKNGVHDGPEAGIDGVQVSLDDSNGVTVGRMITGVDPSDSTRHGYYRFDLLDADTIYTVKLDRPSDLTTGGPLAGFVLTGTNAGTDDAIDNDASLVSNVPTIANATTGSGGTYTPIYDFGFWKEPLGVVVGNFVWVDTNGNGIQDDGPASGLPDVNVTLLDENENPVTRDIQGNPISSTQVTGEGGQYLFTNLMPGVYKVKFEVPLQFAEAETAAGTDTTLDSNGAMATSRRLELGQSDLTLDLGLLPKLAPTTVPAPATTVPAPATTVPVPVPVPETTVPETTVPAPATSVTRKVPEQLPAATPAAPATSPLSATTSGIKGTVYVDQDGSKEQGSSEPGRPGVTVRLVDLSGRVIATTTTDANGHYSFDVPPGEYTVEIEVPSDAKATTVIRRTVEVKGNQLTAEVDFGVLAETDAVLALTGNTNAFVLVNFAACFIVLGSIMQSRARRHRKNFLQ